MIQLIDTLHVWDANHALIGRFHRASDESVSFSYEGDVKTPISLSLPLDGSWNDAAPFLFLDGMLPDDNNERYRMMDSLGAASIHPFDLLDAVDTAGGLSFTSSPECPTPDNDHLEIFTDSDIAARIKKISIEPVNAWDIDRESRFSLAGTQGKFTLVHYRGNWFRPTAGIPSTHIAKPDAKRLPGSSAVELVSMDIAEAVGLPTPAHGTLSALDQSAYVVERFDREIESDGFARRIHTEDLTQALGVPRTDKYDVEISEVLHLLMRVDPSFELAYSWLDQVALNVAVGNCDAHAKNYSLFLCDNGPRLCPLYDVVCTLTWSQFDKGLAMPMNDDMYFANELRPSDWKAEAQRAGLDGFRVADRALEISRAVRDAAGALVQPLPVHLRESMLKGIAWANEHMG